MGREKRGHALIVDRIDLVRHPDVGRLDDAAGHALVVADAHGDCGRQLGQAFAADIGASAIGQPEECAFRIDDLDADAAAARFVDDDARIGVEIAVVEMRLGKQGLVDDVLVLDGKHRNAEEAELFVKRDGLFVVMNDRQVHIGAVPGLEIFRKMPYQRLADSGQGRLRVDRKTP